MEISSRRFGAATITVKETIPGEQAAIRPFGSSCLSVDPKLEWGVAAQFDELPMSQPEWDTAVEKLGGSVYMTWDWLQTWYKFYGQGCELRLFWFHKEGELVGLLPLYVQRIGLRPLHVTVARLVGANIPPKVFDPPFRPEALPLCLGMAAHYLVNRGVDVISIGPVSGAHAAWGRWEPEAASMPGAVRWSRKVSGVHSLFELATNPKDYLARLGPNAQKARRKYEFRMLKKEYPVRLVTIQKPGPELQEAYHRFVELHTLQWRAEGLTGHFNAWPRGREYNEALVQAHAYHGRVRILEVWAAEKLICGLYAYSWGDRWFGELPARAVDPQWDRFSLGPSGLFLLLAEAMREGRRWVEGGLGHYVYKLRLGAREHPVWTYHASAYGSGAVLRRLCALCVQSCLRIGYHKLWYRRIQPRLPERWKRPQWKIWLAYDY